MLLSLAISSIRKNWCFTHLTLENIIQGVMEEGPTIGALLSCLTFKPSAFTILSSMTIWRASTISNSKKWKIRASFTSERYPRQNYTVNKVLRSRISALLVDPEFWTERAPCRKFLRNSVSFDSVGTGKVVFGNGAGNPQNVGLLDLGLRPSSPESQPISNQPICKIQVPAFWGVSN